MVASGQLQPGQLRTLWKSETIAGSPIAIASKVSPELRQKIADTFVQKANVDYLTANGFCSSTADCKVGEDTGWGFAAIDDSLYDGVRHVCDVTKAKSCTSLG